MSQDDERVPLDACTLPGLVSLTPRAMELAERFQTVVPKGWIAAFSWYDGGRTRASKDAPWVDTGPGLDLGAYRLGQIPEEVIWRAGSMRYTVLIRKEIIDSHPQKTIDVDASGKLVFR